MCVKSQGGVYRRDPSRAWEPLEGAQIKLPHTLAPMYSLSNSYAHYVLFWNCVLELLYAGDLTHSPLSVKPVFSIAGQWALCSCMQGDVRVDSIPVPLSWLDFSVWLSHWPSAVGGHTPPYCFLPTNHNILMTLTDRNAYLEAHFQTLRMY